MGTAEDYELRWSKFLRAQSQYIVFSNRGSARRLHRWLYVVRPYLRERMPALYSLAKRVSNGVHMGRTLGPPVPLVPWRGQARWVKDDEVAGRFRAQPIPCSIARDKQFDPMYLEVQGAAAPSVESR